jgi:hypothetical protein
MTAIAVLLPVCSLIRHWLRPVESRHVFPQNKTGCHRGYLSKFNEDSFTRSYHIKLQGTPQLRITNLSQQQFLTIGLF